MVKKVLYVGVVVASVFVSTHYSVGCENLQQEENTFRVLEIDNEQPIDVFDELDDLIDDAVNSGAFRVVPLREPSSAEVLARRLACFVFIKYVSIYGAVASGIDMVKSYIMSAWNLIWGKNQQKASNNGENR